MRDTSSSRCAILLPLCGIYIFSTSAQYTQLVQGTRSMNSVFYHQYGASFLQNTGSTFCRTWGHLHAGYGVKFWQSARSFSPGISSAVRSQFFAGQDVIFMQNTGSVFATVRGHCIRYFGCARLYHTYGRKTGLRPRGHRRYIIPW